MGKLTLTVFLALCPSIGNAFVIRALASIPVDSSWNRQASASLGAPLGIGRRLGADGALSRAGCNDGEDYAAWCSRRNRPLHGSKGVEVRAYTFKRCLPRPHRQAQSLLSKPNHGPHETKLVYLVRVKSYHTYAYPSKTIPNSKYCSCTPSTPYA